jgi:hypothetical protein
MLECARTCVYMWSVSLCAPFNKLVFNMQFWLENLVE